ncbi:TRAP transporter small permease subunit [uncultured Thalassospira sp.]|uniref:TRAP transporter small permease n=1 Tax=uncultured Thalassospira sp. TaxID=404382 RepID=UPI0030D8CF73
MNTIRKTALAISLGLDRLAGIIAIIALSVLVGSVLLQVVARYVFASPPSWTEELARYAMIWAGLIGATMSFKRRFDPALFTGSSTGGGLMAVITGTVQSAVVIIYLTPVLWYCFFGPGNNPARGFLLRHSRTTADALDFSTLWVAIAVPVMIVIILVHLIARWAGDDGQPSAPAPAKADTFT